MAGLCVSRTSSMRLTALGFGAKRTSWSPNNHFLHSSMTIQTPKMDISRDYSIQLDRGIEGHVRDEKTISNRAVNSVDTFALCYTVGGELHSHLDSLLWS